MKKMFVLILTLAMLTTAVAAIAEDGPGGPMGGQPPLTARPLRRSRKALKADSSPICSTPASSPRPSTTR